MTGIDWKMVSLVVAILGAWSGLLIGAIKFLIERAIRGNDTRFARIEADLEEESKKRRELEREFRGVLADLPLKYVQREDWIRLASSIDAKMDALNRKLDDVKDRIYARG